LLELVVSGVISSVSRIYSASNTKVGDATVYIHATCIFETLGT
jgi:hypothetical protein